MKTEDEGLQGPPRDDGLVVLLHGPHVLVHGGWCYDRLWRLSLPSLEWTEHACGGLAAPSPRRNHAGGVVPRAAGAGTVGGGDRMIVCGGERLAPGRGVQRDEIDVFELDLSTLVWREIVECAGDAPLRRSHHTASTVRGGEVVVVLGGKPVTGNRVTSSAMEVLCQRGFYDVFLLHVASMMWQRVEVRDPIAPLCWGHSTAVHQDEFLLCYGGFNVAIADQDPNGPPVVTLQDGVRVFNTSKMRWGKCDDEVSLLQPTREPVRSPGRILGNAPQPRALHTAATGVGEMLVVGGMMLDGHGQPRALSEVWGWCIDTGRWRSVPACSSISSDGSSGMWPVNSSRVAACVYQSQLVCLKGIESVSFCDLRRSEVEWQTLPCQPAPSEWIQSSPFSSRNLDGEKLPPTPASSSAFFLAEAGRLRGEVGPPPNLEEQLRLRRGFELHGKVEDVAGRAESLSEVEQLRREVERLQEVLVERAREMPIGDDSELTKRERRVVGRESFHSAVAAYEASMDVAREPPLSSPVALDDSPLRKYREQQRRKERTLRFQDMARSSSVDGASASSSPVRSLPPPRYVGAPTVTSSVVSTSSSSLGGHALSSSSAAMSAVAPREMSAYRHLKQRRRALLEKQHGRVECVSTTVDELIGRRGSNGALGGSTARPRIDGRWSARDAEHMNDHSVSPRRLPRPWH